MSAAEDLESSRKQHAFGVVQSHRDSNLAQAKCVFVCVLFVSPLWNTLDTQHGAHNAAPKQPPQKISERDIQITEEGQITDLSSRVLWCLLRLSRVAWCCAVGSDLAFSSASSCSTSLANFSRNPLNTCSGMFLRWASFSSNRSSSRKRLPSMNLRVALATPRRDQRERETEYQNVITSHREDMFSSHPLWRGSNELTR
jgi:hypothetical protein